MQPAMLSSASHAHVCLPDPPGVGQSNVSPLWSPSTYISGVTCVMVESWKIHTQCIVLESIEEEVRLPCEEANLPDALASKHFCNKIGRAKLSASQAFIVKFLVKTCTPRMLSTSANAPLTCACLRRCFTKIDFLYLAVVIVEISSSLWWVVPQDGASIARRRSLTSG